MSGQGDLHDYAPSEFDAPTPRRVAFARARMPFSRREPEPRDEADGKAMNAAGKSGGEQNMVNHKITMSAGGHLWQSAAIPI